MLIFGSDFARTSILCPQHVQTRSGIRTRFLFTSFHILASRLPRSSSTKVWRQAVKSCFTDRDPMAPIAILWKKLLSDLNEGIPKATMLLW